MIKIWLLSLGLCWSATRGQQPTVHANADPEQALVGSWHGRLKGTLFIITFNNDHSAQVRSSATKKLYLFSYKIILKSLMLIGDGHRQTRHTFAISNHRLKIDPFQARQANMVNAIDGIAYLR